jgi:Transglycosylase SLT domain
MRFESFGDPRAISQKGAIGLMQVMPKTHAELRIRHRRGGDPCDPHDNILAGAAYLRVMLDRYGAPGVLAAYNAGPARYDEHLMKGRPLPGETQDYVAKLAPMIGVQQGDERTAHSFDLIAWLQAALFPPHADPSPGAVLLAVRAQPDRSPAVRRIVDLSALAPSSDGLFVRLASETGSR